MKNIVIINHHASIPKYGGGGRHHQFAEELSKRGYNITLVSSSFSQGTGEYQHSEKMRSDKLNENYTFLSIKTSPTYKSDMKKRLFNYLDFTKKTKRLEFRQNPDVVIASSVHPFTWIAGYKLARKYNAKFVVEVRDLWPLSLYEDLNKKIRPFIFKYFNWLEKRYYNLASSIIVTAPNAHKYMNDKYNIDEEKIFFIPHCIDLDEYDKNLARDVPEKINKVLKERFSITYTGALSRSEGLESFLYLAKRLESNKEIRFVIVGSGSEKESLLNLIDELEITNVYMFDRVPREDIPSILFQSSVLYCGLIDRKAFEYGISKNKFYDYMAAKKPTIFMSNINDSAIEKANCGYVIKDYSIDKAESVVKELYNDKELYKVLSENARNYVEENHTIEITTDRLIEALS